MINFSNITFYVKYENLSDEDKRVDEVPILPEKPL